MVDLSLFLVTLSVREAVSLPETKTACARILEDPGLWNLNRNQAFLLGDLLFRSELVAKEFLLAWVLRACESLKSIAPLALNCRFDEPIERDMCFDVKHGSAKFASLIVLDELKGLRFDDLTVDPETSTAIFKALDASGRLSIPLLKRRHVPEGSIAAIKALLAVNAEPILRCFTGDLVQFPASKMASLLEVLGRYRVTHCAEELIVGAMEKVLNHPELVPFCVYLWDLSADKATEERVAVASIRTILSFADFRERVSSLLTLVVEALKRNVPVWDNVGPAVVDVLFTEDNVKLSNDVLSVLRSLLRTAHHSDSKEKLPPAVFERFLDVCDWPEVLSAQIRDDYESVVANAMDDRMGNIVDITEFVRYRLETRPAPYNEAQMERMVAFVDALPSEKQQTTIVYMLEETIRSLTSPNSRLNPGAIGLSVAYPWYLLHLPKLFYRLPIPERSRIATLMRKGLEETAWTEGSTLKLCLALPGLLMMSMAPFVDVNQIPEVLHSLSDDYRVLNEFRFPQSFPKLSCAVTGAIMRALCSFNEDVCEMGIAVFRTYLNSGVQTEWTLPQAQPDVPVPILIQHSLRDHGDTFVRYATATSFWEDSIQVLLQAAKQIDVDTTTKIACATSTTARIEFELKQRSVSPKEWGDLYRAIGKFADELFRLSITLTAKRYSVAFKRPLEDCMEIASITSLREDNGSVKSAFEVLFGTAASSSSKDGEDSVDDRPEDSGNDDEASDPDDYDGDDDDGDDHHEGHLDDDGDEDDDDNSHDEDGVRLDPEARRIANFIRLNRRLTRTWVAMLQIDSESTDNQRCFHQVFFLLTRCLSELLNHVVWSNEFNQEWSREFTDSIIARIARSRVYRSAVSAYRFFNLQKELKRVCGVERAAVLGLFASSLARAKAIVTKPALLECVMEVIVQTDHIKPFPVAQCLTILVALVSQVREEHAPVVLSLVEVLQEMLNSEDKDDAEFVRTQCLEFLAQVVNHFDFAVCFRYCALNGRSGVHLVEFFLTVLPLDDVLAAVISLLSSLISEDPGNVERILRTMYKHCDNDADRGRVLHVVIDALEIALDDSIPRNVTRARRRTLVGDLILLLDELAQLSSSVRDTATTSSAADQGVDTGLALSYARAVMWVAEYHSIYRDKASGNDNPANSNNQHAGNASNLGDSERTSRARAVILNSGGIGRDAAEPFLSMSDAFLRSSNNNTDQEEGDGIRRRWAAGGRPSRDSVLVQPGPTSLRLRVPIEPEFVNRDDIARTLDELMGMEQQDNDGDGNDNDEDQGRRESMASEERLARARMNVAAATGIADSDDSEEDMNDEDLMSSDSDERGPNFSDFVDLGSSRMRRAPHVPRITAAAVKAANPKLVSFAEELGLDASSSLPMDLPEEGSTHLFEASGAQIGSRLSEALLKRRGLASLLPDSQRCLRESTAIRPIFRCLTCSSTALSSPSVVLLCSACANSCHADHELFFEGAIQADCSCSSDKCRAMIHQPVVPFRNGERSSSSPAPDARGDESPGVLGDRPVPTKRVLPAASAPFIRDILSSEEPTIALIQALHMLFETVDDDDDGEGESGRKEFAMDEPARAFSMLTPSMAAAGFSEHNFEMWKDVEGAKQVLDICNKFQLPVRRLAACDAYLAVAEGSVVTLVNPAHHLCAFQNDFPNSVEGLSQPLTYISSFHSSVVTGSVSALKTDPIESVDIGFPVLQLEFNAVAPELLLVAGLSQCAVLFLTRTGKLIRKVQVAFSAEIPDVIRKALWMPGSRSEFCVVTGTKVKTFDLFCSEKPVLSYRLAEGIAALADAVFLPSTQRVLLLLSSSGCLLRQDLKIGDENEELLICEFLAPPSTNERSATSLIPVSSDSLLIRFTQGRLAFVTLSSSQDQIVNRFQMSDDELGPGRAAGACAVVDGRFLFTTPHGPLRQQGSLAVFDMGTAMRSASSLTMSAEVCGPQAQAAFGKLVGIAVWAEGCVNRRVVALHENGTMVACWTPPSQGRLYRSQKVFQPRTQLFERLTRLAPVSRFGGGDKPQPSRQPPTRTVITRLSMLKQQPSLKPPSYSPAPAVYSLPSWHEFANVGMYATSLSFAARAPAFLRQGSTTPPADNDPEQWIDTPLSKESDLKAAMDPGHPTCLVTESFSLDLYVSFASQTHCVVGLKLHFGAHSATERAVPGIIRVLGREITVSMKHAIAPLRKSSPSPSTSSPIVVPILFTKDEALHIAAVGGVKITMTKATTTAMSHVAIDGVEVFVTRVAFLDEMFDGDGNDDVDGKDGYKDSLIIPGSSLEARRACLRLIASVRASMALSPTVDNLETYSSCRHTIKDLMDYTSSHLQDRIIPGLFPDRYERRKVEAMLSADNLMTLSEPVWHLQKLRGYGRAALRSPTAFDAVLKRGVSHDVQSALATLEATVASLKNLPPVEYMTSLLAIALSMMRVFPDDARPVVFPIIKGLLDRPETSFACCDGLLSCFLVRPNVVRSELQFDANPSADEAMSEEPDKAATEEEAVQFQCDSCFVMPIRHARWTCESCHDFDLCENCFFAAGFDHSASHSFRKIDLDRENPPSACCRNCGDLKALSLPPSLISKTSLCATCLDLGGEKDAPPPADETALATGGDETKRKGLLTARNVAEDLMNEDAQWSVGTIKFIVYVAAGYGLIRTSSSSSSGKDEDGRQFSERVLEWISTKFLNAISDGGDAVDSSTLLSMIKLFGFAAETLLPIVVSSPSSLLSSSRLRDMFTKIETELLGMAKEALDRSSSASSSTSRVVKRPLPSWIGAMDSFIAQLTYADLAWTPRALVTSAGLSGGGWKNLTSLDVADVFTLDRTWAFDPFQGWESIVASAVNAAGALVATTLIQGNSSAGEDDDAHQTQQQWEDLFSRYLAKSSSRRTVEILLGVLRSKGVKVSVRDLLRTGTFRSAIANLQGLCDLVASSDDGGENSSSIRKRDAVYQLAAGLSKLKKAVVQQPGGTESWTRFFKEEEESPLRLLLRVGTILDHEAGLFPSLPLGLVLKGLYGGSEKARLAELDEKSLPRPSAASLSSGGVKAVAKLDRKDTEQLFEWLVDESAGVRLNAMYLLMLRFTAVSTTQGGEEVQWMRNRLLEMATGETGRNIRKVETMVLLSSLLGTKVTRSTVMTGMEKKDLLQTSMDALQATVKRLKSIPLVRSCSRSNAESLSLVLSLKRSSASSSSSSSPSATGKKRDLEALKKLLGSSSSTIAQSSPSTAANATTKSSEEDGNRVSPFSLLFSPPCLTCEHLERPFATRMLDHSLHSQVAYLSSTVVMRLHRLQDLRAIALDLHPVRRGLPNVIDSVIVSVSSQYTTTTTNASATGGGGGRESGADLVALAQDPSLWEQVAVLCDFQPSSPPPTATSTSSSSSSAPPGGGTTMARALAAATGIRIGGGDPEIGGGGGAGFSGKLSSTAILFPMVSATMIKFDFVLVKDKNGDGTGDRLLCPRCSRPVTSDHGVCSNCSEMVFQCRQCRNINYEDPRSFLCVQCGFCRHARFTFKAHVRLGSKYKRIESEKELKLARALLAGSVGKEEQSAMTQLHDVRQPLLESLSRGDPRQYHAAISAAQGDLTEAFQQAYFASKDADALRKVIAFFRRGDGKEKRPAMEDHVVGRRGGGGAEEDGDDSFQSLDTCFTCTYSFAMACSTVVSSLVGFAATGSRDGDDDGIAPRVPLLMEWRDLRTTLESLGPRANLPRSLSAILGGHEGGLEAVSVDPLVSIVAARPGVALQPVMETLKRSFDAALMVPAAFESGIAAVDFLWDLMGSRALFTSPHRQEITSRVIQLLNGVMDSVASQSDGSSLRLETERLGLACLEVFSLIATASNNADGHSNPRKGMKRGASMSLLMMDSSPTSQSSQTSPRTAKRMRESGFEV